MSRIGNAPIKIPSGVKCELKDNHEFVASSSKGTLSLMIPEVISIKIDGDVLTCARANEEKHSKQLHGTTRANIANMIIGLDKGYEKKLVMKGTGYKALANASEVTLYVGYSHPVKLPIPAGVVVSVKDDVNISVSGINKQVVGQLAALIRDTRRPEPYLGKGVAYVNEHIRRKEGKKAGK